VTIPAEAIEHARERDILKVAEQFTRLRKEAANEFVGPCPQCGGTDRFGVNVRKRVFNCRQCDVKGGVIDLMMLAEGVDFKRAVELLAGETWKASEPRREPVRKRESDADNNLGLARVIWKETLPLGDESHAYFAGRKIDISAAPDLGGLRYHPRCPWGSGGGFAPCIVARFSDPVTGERHGIWRRRIDIHETPRSLGPMAGCVIRLWPDDEVTTGLVIGEGVETVLAAATRIRHLGTLLQPAWAAGGTGNLRALPVLAGIEVLTILVDHDEKGDGERAAAACAERWIDAGREVVRLTPKLVGDFNDVVREER
jgi:hypothetical protein